MTTEGRRMDRGVMPGGSWQRTPTLPGLFDQPRARTSDPWTSKAAAASVDALSAEHFRVILAALEVGPATKDGIALRCGLDEHRVGKRLPELARMGRIVETGRALKGPSGRMAREWRLTGGGACS